jgi:CheY-like chemotaxis protein
LCDEYDVVTANDLHTAIRRATFYKPDISILDLQMPPEKDSPAGGLQLLEYIKGHLSNSRVLIMSSNATTETRRACFAAGADGFFAKPFEIQDMLASICKLSPVHRLELFAHIL